MEYKLSRYNLIVDQGTDYIVYNSLKKSFTKISKYIYDLLLSSSAINDENLQTLLDQGIICDNEIDEEELAFAKYNSIVHDDVLRIIIMPTMNCNFRCVYCYEKHIEEKMSQETINSLLNYVEANIGNYRSLQVDWFGGEPLLCMEIIEEVNSQCLKICKNNNKLFLSLITTNGYLLSYENFIKLRKLHINKFQITLDGDEKFHNLTRPLKGGYPTFNRIINNLLDIKNKCKSVFLTFLIRINISKLNIGELSNFETKLKDLFSDDKRFVFYMRKVGDWGGEDVKSFTNNIIGEDYDINSTLVKDSLISTDTQFVGFARDNICYACKDSTLLIHPNGNVSKCTVDLYSDYNIIGKLDKNGQINYNNNTLVDRVKNAYLDDKCRLCTLYANCFNTFCLSKMVINGGTRSSNCLNKPNELKKIYEINPEAFKEIY